MWPSAFCPAGFLPWLPAGFFLTKETEPRKMINGKEIRISLGNDRPCLLWPSIRCANSLARRYHGFEPIARAIIGGNLTICADVIMEATGHTLTRKEVSTFLCSPLSNLTKIIPTMLQFIMQLAGVKEKSQSAQGESSGKQIPLEEYYEQLFRVGTGTLGWTPKETWNATAHEIIEASKGKIEFMKAIYGGGEKTEDGEGEYNDSVFDPSGFAALKSMQGAF